MPPEALTLAAISLQTGEPFARYCAQICTVALEASALERPVMFQSRLNVPPAATDWPLVGVVNVIVGVGTVMFSQPGLEA